MFCQAGASVRIRLLPVFRRFRRSPVISNLRSRSGLSQVHIHQRADREQLGGILLQSSIVQIHTEDRRQGLERSPRLDLGSGRKGLVCRCRHPRRTCASACTSSGKCSYPMAEPRSVRRNPRISAPRWSPSGYSELGSKWQYVDDGKFLIATYACRILLLAGHALPRIAAGP